jgi:predicted metal-dependent HD superfamily phosphohydrolase
MGQIGQAWLDSIAELGGDPEVASASAAALEEAYAAPARSYHSSSHILGVLSGVATLAAPADLSATDIAVARAAACAHDVVYDGRPGDDERASASWAASALSVAGVPGPYIARIRELILATITHQSDGSDRAAGVLLDADLAILASPPDDYAQYVAAIRREYPHVNDADWLIGRAQVLRALLESPHLYATDEARKRWQDAAIGNLRRELRALESGTNPSS